VSGPVRDIAKLLIANRGEIAARIMRTAQAMDISCVAVYPDDDADAPYVRQADEAVRLPGSTPADTYLDAQQMIGAARRTGADAIHPGYGFLAESAAFARACVAAGLVFVGPSADVIETMGAKRKAKQVAAAAGLPVLPDLPVGPDVSGDTRSFAERVRGEVGLPALVKAVYGGGGRGLRLVHDPADLAGALTAARHEAESSFGDGAIFVERYVERPRHVEVQIIGDAAGDVADLGERDCSVQRRYQKVIEEGPAPNVGPALRQRLGAAAVALARAVGYVGVGTVEFVLDAAGRFYFVEMNTRLQVEHPVTELVSGLDLVRLQIVVAQGEPLPAAARQVVPTGHAIEARLCAEDVTDGFRPAVGTIHEFAVPTRPGIRVDSGIEPGSTVSVHFDSLLAKVIAHGSSRDEARRLLARTLAETRVHGVETNRDLLVAVLREPDFRAGRVDTDYLVRHEPVRLLRAARDPRTDAIHALAAALADQAQRRARAQVLGAAPSGWRNVPGEWQLASYLVAGHELLVRYALTRSGLEATVNADPLGALTLHRAASEVVDLEVAGIRRRFRIGRAGNSVYVDSALGASTLAAQLRFVEVAAAPAGPGSLLAPMPGTVVRVDVEIGAAVASGAPIVVLEAMKIEHVVSAPAAGTVIALGVTIGQTVDAGAVLAVVEGSSA
jgi:propionyl-CoA carboxylase alpha chain